MKPREPICATAGDRFFYETLGFERQHNSHFGLAREQCFDDERVRATGERPIAVAHIISLKPTLNFTAYTRFSVSGKPTGRAARRDHVAGIVDNIRIAQWLDDLVMQFFVVADLHQLL